MGWMGHTLIRTHTHMPSPSRAVGYYVGTSLTTGSVGRSVGKDGAMGPNTAMSYRVPPSPAGSVRAQEINRSRARTTVIGWAGWWAAGGVGSGARQGKVPRLVS